MLANPPSFPPPGPAGGGQFVHRANPNPGQQQQPANANVGGALPNLRGLLPFGGRPPFHPFNKVYPKPGDKDYEAKIARKSSMRKTVDYNASIIKHLETRVWQRDLRDRPLLQPDVIYYPELLPPSAYPDNPINAVTTRFVKVATNKMRCPVFCLSWTPDGRRLITGSSSGEFTLWNGLTFNFETILQAHDSPVRTMVWSHSDIWMVTGDHSGYVKYWQSNMNNVKLFQAHKEPLRGIRKVFNTCQVVDSRRKGNTTRVYVERMRELIKQNPKRKAYYVEVKEIKVKVKEFEGNDGSVTWHYFNSFCPTDQKIATCSDDGTVRIWDFVRCQEEKVLRGHGADVKCVDWHPHKGLIVSGSKDNQQPIKLWDPKSGQSLATLHAHKSTVMDARWNKNGNWLITASRDHLVKLFDIRKLQTEVQTFRGHKKEAACLSWHPHNEGVFASGGSDGAILFWNVGTDKEVGVVEQAHESLIWSLSWHPVGHLLCSGSNDHTSKFWTRNRPGDKMRDKYNLNMGPAGGPSQADSDDDEVTYIPGMDEEVEETPNIPGLDFESGGAPTVGAVGGSTNGERQQRKLPYSRPENRDQGRERFRDRRDRDRYDHHRENHRDHNQDNEDNDDDDIQIMSSGVDDGQQDQTLREPMPQGDFSQTGVELPGIGDSAGISDRTEGPDGQMVIMPPPNFNPNMVPPPFGAPPFIPPPMGGGVPGNMMRGGPGPMYGQRPPWMPPGGGTGMGMLQPPRGPPIPNMEDDRPRFAQGGNRGGFGSGGPGHFPPGGGPPQQGQYGRPPFPMGGPGPRGPPILGGHPPMMRGPHPNGNQQSWDREERNDFRAERRDGDGGSGGGQYGGNRYEGQNWGMNRRDMREDNYGGGNNSDGNGRWDEPQGDEYSRGRSGYNGRRGRGGGWRGGNR